MAYPANYRYTKEHGDQDDDKSKGGYPLWDFAESGWVKVGLRYRREVALELGRELGREQGVVDGHRELGVLLSLRPP